ncbi:hypothetical protein EG829_25375, partial [bacterium]|nr:hypothetical protein [bacterium]
MHSGTPHGIRVPVGDLRRTCAQCIRRIAFGLLFFFACACVAWAQAPNRVLHLDGNQSYIELPPDIFQELTETTVEAWVKFGSLDQSRFYSYGAPFRDLGLGHAFRDPTALNFFVSTNQGASSEIVVPGSIA